MVWEAEAITSEAFDSLSYPCAPDLLVRRRFGITVKLCFDVLNKPVRLVLIYFLLARPKSFSKPGLLSRRALPQRKILRFEVLQAFVKGELAKG